MRRQDKQLRHFGLIVGGLFAVIGLWPMLFRAHGAPTLGAGARHRAGHSGPRAAPQLDLCPPGLDGGRRGPGVGQHAHHPLGDLLRALTPMGILMRRFGQDPMQRGFEPDATTYRVAKPTRTATHMTRQF